MDAPTDPSDGTGTIDQTSVPGPALLVAVRDDGRVAIRRGLPSAVTTRDLRRALDVGSGDASALAVALQTGRDDEVLAQLGRFVDAHAAVLDAGADEELLRTLGYASWLARTRCCPRCGTELTLEVEGRRLRCTGCGATQFPRLDPAVIMRVVDADGRLLLARRRANPAGRFSVLAGFVEPGEDLETTVRREVAEEVGVRVGEVRYLASQPWPFPASLMLGFEGRAETTDLTFEDDEIGEARWVTREELTEAMDRRELAVPPPMSIAYRLIADWFGGAPRTWDQP